MEENEIPQKGEIVSTISYSNDEIILNIMKLYGIEQFDLDCTYSKGVFWKNIIPPVHKTDLVPQTEDTTQADSANLPFANDSFRSIMFDPPFIINGPDKEYKDGSAIMKKRFSGYVNYAELKEHYYKTMKECHRILKEDGYLVLKCQDTVSSGKNHFTHCMVMQMAIELGYRPMDMFVLLAKSRLTSFGGRWFKQFHARKYHSYFWVFQKSTKKKIDYSFEHLK